MTATLDPEELNALMSAIQDGKVSPGDAASQKHGVVPYDLTSRDRIIRGQMPTLDAINEQTASMVGTGWSGRIRRAIRVTSTPATLLKFIDFNSMLTPPATVCVLNLGEGHGPAVAVLEPGLAESLLAAALGDRKMGREETPPENRRELTSVEKMVLKRLLMSLTDAMSIAWGPVLPLKPEVVRFESDPRLASIAPPNEAAVLCTFEVSGGLTGRLQLAIPYSAVEPSKKLLSSPPRVSGSEDSRFMQALSRELDHVAVDICAVLGTAHVQLDRLLEFEVGDLLMLDSDEGSPLAIRVQGRDKLLANPRVHGGNIAMVVERTLVSEDHNPFALAGREAVTALNLPHNPAARAA
jgi:flagellar motor switch protein FliM